MSSIVLLSLLAVSALAFPSPQGCKVSYDSPDWPPASIWSQLNQTLGGKLLAPLPPAVVCDAAKPQYNTQICASLDKEWTDTIFLDQDPLTLHAPNWQNESCLPPSLYNRSNSCDLKPFAKYVVNASQPQDVVDGIKFAALHNLRVSVKNTGHDYLGRSTSPGFQIWTHHLKGMEIRSNFTPSGCESCQPADAVTIHSGEQYGYIYNFTAAHNRTVAGGATASVGLGGHLTGGGHSPLGAMVGLAVDNVLELTMVTPAGELITANEHQNSDLFWAMRGGGGSTYGVLVTVTERTYPAVKAAKFQLQFQSTETEAATNNNTNFYSLLADLHAEVIDWTDNYINGYSFVSPTALTGAGGLGGASAALSFDASKPYTMSFSFDGAGLFQNASQLRARMQPFMDKVHNTTGVSGNLTVTPVADSRQVLSSQIDGTVGYNAIFGSRLWDRNALLNKTGLIQTYRGLGPNYIQSLVISGPALRDESRIATTSVTPAWRRTYMHIVTASTWAFHNETMEAEARASQTELTRLLQDHAPDTGAYLNEADIEQPDAPKAFWGDNYERLLSIKRQYDPQGMFWCKPCVGWEDWIMDEASGSLCRK